MIIALALTGCSGDDGQDGRDGVDGIDGVDGVDGQDGQDGQDLTAALEPESCSVCHKGSGDHHQAVYDLAYGSESTFDVTINGVASVAGKAEGYDVTMTFTIMKDGLPYIDADGLPSLDQKRFYAIQYDKATRMFINSKSFSASSIMHLGEGVYTITATGAAYAPEMSDAAVYMYIAKGAVHVEQPAGSHVHLYDEVVNVGMGFGALAPDSVDNFVSYADSKGCEKCHGEPYMKHGYRGAIAEGLADFVACKVCHYDTRTGGHEDWQILADNPLRYAEIHAGSDITPEEEAQYAYTANVMNDTHMSHAMEFPYPQSMANCVVCHEGKLDMILADDMMTMTTCKSCHPMNGSADYGTADVAITNITPHPLPDDGICNTCHSQSGFAPAFNEIHNGYNKVIYADDAGTKYADVFTVSIDSASFADNILNVQISASKNADLSELTIDDMIPTLMIGLYGYDTKDFIVGCHERDADRNRLGEFVLDGESVNPRFEVVSSGGGSWSVNFNMSEWADYLTSGVVKRCEIGVMPDVTLVIGERDYRGGPEDDDITYAVNAPSRTFDLVANAFDDGFFQPIADVNKCNACHEALATTFHSGNRGGSIAICRMCHITKSGGSHLEMQSRSLDSYVHAIHSFQPFDIGDVNFDDPVEAVRYDLHVNHTYPYFTITACESCHYEGTYNVPDQSKSLGGLLSSSDEVAGRNIGDVPSYITGPGSRACGACHRADMINADEYGALVSFNQHTKDFGYLENADERDLLEVIEEIMAFFN